MVGRGFREGRDAEAASKARGSKRPAEARKSVSPHELAKMAVLQQKDLDREATAKAFDSVDPNWSGWVDEEQVRQVLQQLLGNRKINEHGFRLVMDGAHRSATVNGKMTEDKENTEPGKLPRVEVQDTCVKYRYYLERSGYYDLMYARFDSDKVGKVNRKQLLTALDENKKKPPAEQKIHFGKIAELHATIFNKDTFNDDLDFVLQESFTEDDGSIDRSEMLPAMATWEMLSEKYFEGKPPDACCSIQ